MMAEMDSIKMMYTIMNAQIGTEGLILLKKIITSSRMIVSGMRSCLGPNLSNKAPIAGDMRPFSKAPGKSKRPAAFAEKL